MVQRYEINYRKTNYFFYLIIGNVYCWVCKAFILFLYDVDYLVMSFY
jgi:hypothetical protein